LKREEILPARQPLQQARANFPEAISGPNDSAEESAPRHAGRGPVFSCHREEQSHCIGFVYDIEIRYINDICVEIGKLAAQLLQDAVVRTGKVAEFDEGE
jgi:hypothetical protein